jgi:hypothetical protein
MIVFSAGFVGALSLLFPAPPPPSVHCQLHETDRAAHRWEGSCGRLFDEKATLRLTPAKSITTGRWRADAMPSAVWAGEVGNVDDTVELEIYPGNTGVLRTQKGWFGVTAFVATPERLEFDVDASRKIEPTSLDADIVRRADALLSSAAVWNRADNRQCPASATTWSIYCAMARATIDVTCGFHHRRPAMELVRVIIEARSAGRNYDHRLMDYNNDTTTTLADVHAIFNEALARMSASKGEAADEKAVVAAGGVRC